MLYIHLLNSKLSCYFSSTVPKFLLLFCLGLVRILIINYLSQAYILYSMYKQHYNNYMYTHNRVVVIIYFIFSANAKSTKRSKQKKGLLETVLIPQVEILKFYEGVTLPQDFTLLISKAITQISVQDINESAIHRICWEFYSNVCYGQLYLIHYQLICSHNIFT